MTGPSLFVVCGAVLLVAAADAPRERIVTGDGIVPGNVATMPGRILVDPGAPSMLMLAPDYAARIGLRPGMFGMRYMVGPVSVDGSSAVTTIDTGGGPRKRRVAWTAQPYTADADGVIGPGGLAEDVVRFALRPPRPGERTVTLPMVDAGGLMGGKGGLFARIELGGQPLKVRFDLRHRRTVATAIDRLFVRVADFGDASIIADERDDPDEVVVTAGKKRDPDRDRLSVGLDQLDRCSSIVFDKRARQITLSCT